MNFDRFEAIFGSQRGSSRLPRNPPYVDVDHVDPISDGQRRVPPPSRIAGSPQVFSSEAFARAVIALGVTLNRPSSRGELGLSGHGSV